MKRVAGFKVGVPFVLDYLIDYEIPIYICLDTNIIEMSIKPRSASSQLEDKELLKTAINHVLSLYPETSVYLNKVEITYIVKNKTWKRNNLAYIVGGLLIGLFEENQLQEYIGDVIKQCSQLDLSDKDKAIIKTLLSGGIMYSDSLIHDRIFSSKGLYFKLVEKPNQTFNAFSANDVGLIILSLIKDQVSYLRDRLGHIVNLDNGEVGYLQSLGSDPTLLIIEHNNGEEKNAIFSINQNGGNII